MYATLGMIGTHNDLMNCSFEQASELVIDYKTTVQDVYSSVVKELVLGSKQLNVLPACVERGPLVQ